MKNILTTLILLIVAIDAQAVQIHVETDRQNYYAGQEVNVTIIAVNTQSVDVVLSFNAVPETKIAVDVPAYGSGGFPTEFFVSIPAYGTNVWSWELDWEQWPLSTGSHTVNGLVVGYGDATSQPFLVEQTVLPEDEVLIDFHSIPGTEAVIGSSLFAYDACGIHFASETSNNNIVPGVNREDQRLVISRTTYPPGFNINATLDFPVYGVEVDAYSAVGRQITMIAKDGDGEVIASATSAPMSDFESPQKMKLTASRRIERLEWWPSRSNSGVGIDNLRLYRTPCISMERTQQMLTLHWPPDVANSSLEVCTNLEDAVWEPLLSSIGTNEVSVSTTNAAYYFFRLRIEEDI